MPLAKPPEFHEIDRLKRTKRMEIYRQEQKIVDINAEIEHIRFDYNAKILNELKKIQETVENFTFAKPVVKIFDDFATKNGTDAFTVLNPLYGYKSKAPPLIPPRNKRGAFGGGQFGVEKKDGEWEIYGYESSLRSSWCECKLGLRDFSADLSERAFATEANKCINAFTDDLIVLNFINELANTHPDALARYLEY